jgi:hypothetical protein
MLLGQRECSVEVVEDSLHGFRQRGMAIAGPVVRLIAWNWLYSSYRLLFLLAPSNNNFDKVRLRICSDAIRWRSSGMTTSLSRVVPPGGFEPSDT